MNVLIAMQYEIVEVVKDGPFYNVIDGYERYYEHELDFNDTPDYWTRLEHQYTGMAMQGILANIDLFMSLAKKKANDYPAKYTVAEYAKDYAHALVEKIKEERK